MDLLLLILIIVLLFGGGYGYTRRADWGPAPVGILGVILIVILLLYFFRGHLHAAEAPEIENGLAGVSLTSPSPA